MSKKGPYTGVTVKELIHDADEARKSGKFKWLQEYCPTCHAITFVPEPEGYMYCQSCGRKRSQYAKTNHIVDADKMLIDSLSGEKAVDVCTCKDCDCTGKYCEECGKLRRAYKADSVQEELARIFNRTDDKEELYKQALELLRKIRTNNHLDYTQEQRSEK